MIENLVKGIKDDRKYFFVVFLILVLIILSGIVTPIIINQQRQNWDSELTTKITQIESSMKGLFRQKELKVVNTRNWLKSNLVKTFKSSTYNYKELIELINRELLNDYSIEVIAPNGKIIAWNKKIAIPQEEIFPLAYDFGETYFHSTGLFTYLSIIDTVEIQHDVFYILVSEKVDKHFQIQNEYYDDKSFTKELSEKFFTKCFIDYDPFAAPRQDGRIYSFPLTNINGIQIGRISFYKPSLNIALNGIADFTAKTQSALIVLVCIFIGLSFRREYLLIQNRAIKFIVLLIYITTFRVLILLVDFPTMFLSGPLVNPANFSSTLAWGLVKSPVEFFITNIGLVIIGIQMFRYCFQYLNEEKSKRWWILQLLSIPILFTAAFYLLRGLSASIKSVIFDSTIRYFKDPTPVPNADVVFMNLNVIMLGFSAVLLIAALLILIGIFTRIEIPKYKLLKLIIFFLVTQLLVHFFFENLREPLITQFMVFVFILIIFILIYTVYYRKQNFLQLVLYGTIVSSVITVVLMNYFNLQLERTSLKTVAFEIIRANENLMYYMSDETLRKTLRDEEIINSFYRSNINYDAAAFRIWSSSPMQRESISSGIFLYDEEQREIGSFSVGLENHYDVLDYFDEIYLNEPSIVEVIDSVDTDIIRYVGIIPVAKREIVSGYIVAITEFNIQNIDSRNIPDLLKSNNAVLGAAIDASLLKIFEIRDTRLTQVYGDIYPSREQLSSIYNAKLTEFNEAWINFSIYEEDYIAYVIKISGSDEDRFISVAAKENEVTWNLFNFFKLFLLHAIFISVLFILLISTKLLRIKSSFRTKLLYAFLLVSIVPLGLLAAYNREVVSERGGKAIFDELSKRSDYLQNHVSSQLSKHKERGLITAFQNAGKELNISFAVYQNTDLMYSSREEFYRTGLFNYKLNPEAHYNLNYLSYREHLTNENLDNYNYFSYYRKVSFDDVALIIGVNDAFNRIKPSFSTSDIDVILFGIYSFALIIIIIVSTVLANQISAPIRRLTKATEVVAKGDLDVQLERTEKGEMKELYDGFNLMTRELQKNQIELAELERETAWKEMAKQVAHEIKNPLTPIKLAIQQLIASYRDKNENFDSIFENVTQTTLSQIDNLSQIASEFSSFAKMPSIKLEVADVIPVIHDTLNLFTDDNIIIDFESEETKAVVESDNSQFRRMLINLIRNSIQAKATYISIRLSQKNDNYSLVLVDNGEGIKEESKSRIFEINYTTKKKGMGLGLKLAHRFVESINGRIVLVDSSPSGTTFEITIPKYYSNDQD
ncbi:ATP-binding protein [Bacteroidota bacterium]